MTIKKVSILVGLISILGFTILQLKPKTNYKTTTILINDQKISAEVAQDPSSRALGLGNRDSLIAGSGMLFVFPFSGKHAIWMKNMRFPIDIIWIRDDQVVDLAENVPPEKSGQELPIYQPDANAKYVLEISAGEAKAWGIKIGSTVRISPVF